MNARRTRQYSCVVCGWLGKFPFLNYLRHNKAQKKCPVCLSLVDRIPRPSKKKGKNYVILQEVRGEAMEGADVRSEEQSEASDTLRQLLSTNGD